jgi:hypothetical protein
MFSLEEYGIEILQKKDRYVYRREKTEKVIFGKKVKFDLFPVVSSGIAHHINLRLKNPFVIPAESKINFQITAPYDLEVRALHGKKWTPLDKISIHKEKYTLYGPVESGELCRYFESTLEQRDNTAQLSLTAENQTKEWQQITKLVFPTQCDLYLDKKVHYPSLDLVITDLGMRVIEVEAPAGLKKIESFIKDLKVRKEYMMVWGY